jgi:hypothetical protein
LAARAVLATGEAFDAEGGVRSVMEHSPESHKSASMGGCQCCVLTHINPTRIPLVQPASLGQKRERFFVGCRN